MRARCSNNPEHKRFLTTAHVVEEWAVDERGDWIETFQTLEVTHGPDTANVWTCVECGADARFDDENEEEEEG
jgi:hypothetical protein